MSDSSLNPLLLPISHLKAKLQVAMPLISLLLLGILSRLPFRAQLVQEWDAGGFALAVDHYDIRLEQPHLPGTFLVYITLARGINAVLHNATASLVLLSVVAAGVAAGLIYQLASQWFDRRVGWVAALLSLVGPVPWFYSEMPLSYTPELCCVSGILLMATSTRNGSRRALYGLAVLMGLAGGIRPNTPIFLLPLALFCVYRGWKSGRYGLRSIMLAIGLGLTALAAWLLPLFHLSGGVEAYWSAVMSWQQTHSQDGNSIMKLYRNLIMLTEAIALSLGVALIPSLLALGRGLLQAGKRWHGWLRVGAASPAILLALWLTPGTVYLLFVHIQRYGHAFTVIPAYLILAALAIVQLGDWLKRFHPQAGIGLAAIVIGFNVCTFVAGPAQFRTWASIHEFDTKFTRRIEFIRSHFPSATTAVVAPVHLGRLPAVYLSEFQVPQLSRWLANHPVVLPPHVNTLVLLDREMYEQDPRFTKIPLPIDGKLRYLIWETGQQLKVTETSVEFIPLQKGK